MNNIIKQRGVTLIELLIGLAVGMFVVSGVLTVYVATIESTSDTIAQSRLNQEVMTLMNVMSTDIRRAGYWAGSNPDDIAGNPFNQSGSTALDVRDVSSNTSFFTAARVVAGTASGDCITYSYDADEDESVDLDELFGFQLIGTDIWMRTSCDNGGVNDCTVATSASCELGAWQRITDNSTIRINTLTFSASGSYCINTTVQDDPSTNSVDEHNCYESVPTASSGEATGEIRKIDIILNADLLNDPAVDASMNINVRVRNDLVRIW